MKKTSTSPKFHDNQRVGLKANAAEGWDAECGTVLGYQGNELYTVEVDEKYRSERGDDGIREVTEDQMVALGKKSKKAPTAPIDLLAKFLRRVTAVSRDILDDDFSFGVLKVIKPKDVEACKAITLEEFLAHPEVRKELDDFGKWVLDGVQKLTEDDLDDVDNGPE